MAGRFSSKRVVAKEFFLLKYAILEDGTPIDVVLNPLGVPSRMNTWSNFETHLGMAARALGYHCNAPSFNGVPSERERFTDSEKL